MTLLDTITCLLPRLAENQRRIAQFILEKPERVLSLSSQQLAETLNVSQSAVVKFSQKVGVKGYPALKLALSEIIGRQQFDEANPHTALHNRITQNDNLMVVAQKLALEKIIRLLKQLAISISNCLKKLWMPLINPSVYKLLALAARG